jgi:hypothetical protein
MQSLARINKLMALLHLNRFLRHLRQDLTKGVLLPHEQPLRNRHISRHFVWQMKQMLDHIAKAQQPRQLQQRPIEIRGLEDGLQSLELELNAPPPPNKNDGKTADLTPRLY